jgi:hypothetical protein
VVFVTCAEQTSISYLLRSAASSARLLQGSSTQLVHRIHLLHRPLWRRGAPEAVHGGSEAERCSLEELPCTANFCAQVILPRIRTQSMLKNKRSPELSPCMLPPNLICVCVGDELNDLYLCLCCCAHAHYCVSVCVAFSLSHKRSHVGVGGFRDIPRH